MTTVRSRPGHNTHLSPVCADKLTLWEKKKEKPLYVAFADF